MVWETWPSVEALVKAAHFYAKRQLTEAEIERFGLRARETARP
jgi:hypothetical protein